MFYKVYDEEAREWVSDTKFTSRKEALKSLSKDDVAEGEYSLVKYTAGAVFSAYIRAYIGGVGIEKFYRVDI